MNPEDCVQNCATQWWIEDRSCDIERGRLIWVFLPHVDQQPMLLIPEDRGEDPTNHKNPVYRIAAMDLGRPQLPPKLPVASLPNYHGEKRTVYRAKKRPALIICNGGRQVAKSFVTGGAKWLKTQTVIVAPYYGGDQDGSRAGFKPAFLERIRHGHYPQFIWDSLPFSSKTNESVLRLDHMQPVGRDLKTIECTDWKLSSEALVYLDDWIGWLLAGLPEPGGELGAVRELLHEYAGAAS